MRICMIVQTLEKFGGLEEIVTTLAVSLSQRGHKPAVVSTVWVQPDNQYKRRLERNGIRLVQWPIMQLVRPLAWMLDGVPALIRTRSRSRAVAAVRQREHWASHDLGWTYLTSRRHAAWTRRLLTAFCAIWRPDLVHVHSYVYDLNLTSVLGWTHARGLPAVFEEHQTPDLSRDVWDDFRRRINQATMVGAVSQKGATILREDLGVRRPIRVLPALVADPMTMTPAGGEPAEPGSPATIVCIARLIPVKGLPYLFEAIARVRESHPAIRFLLYGDGPPQPSARIRASAERCDLDADLIFAGTYAREQLPAIMAAADIFVLPSLNEGFPLTVVEAMACSRPIVATAVGGILDLLQDGVTGLLCPPGDAMSLARALCQLIEHPEQRARLGEAARSAYEGGPFHPEQAVRSYVAMYEETVRIARDDEGS